MAINQELESVYSQYYKSEKQNQLLKDIDWCIDMLQDLKTSAFVNTYNEYNKAEVNRKRIEINNRLMRY